MAVSVESVRALAASGEFDSVKNPSIQKAIDDAGLTIETSSWCETLVDLAHENLAAHILSLRLLPGMSAPGGPLASAGADGLSVGYAVAPGKGPSESYYPRTSYGQEYLRLLRLQPLSPIAGNTQYGHLYG